MAQLCRAVKHPEQLTEPPDRASWDSVHLSAEDKKVGITLRYCATSRSAIYAPVWIVLWTYVIYSV